MRCKLGRLLTLALSGASRLLKPGNGLQAPLLALLSCSSGYMMAISREKPQNFRFGPFLVLRRGPRCSIPVPLAFDHQRCIPTIDQVRTSSGKPSATMTAAQSGWRSLSTDAAWHRLIDETPHHRTAQPHYESREQYAGISPHRPVPVTGSGHGWRHSCQAHTQRMPSRPRSARPHERQVQAGITQPLISSASLPFRTSWRRAGGGWRVYRCGRAWIKPVQRNGLIWTGARRAQTSGLHHLG